ncbi:MAG: uracil-DNA glycosylase family protein [Pseudomonadota bacterium]
MPASTHRQAPARDGGAAGGSDADQLLREIRACRLCAERFAATPTGHAPKPVLQFAPGARFAVAGQAPGVRAHASGRPFDDPSGVRLRRWLGVDQETFWDARRIALAPMGFCFPGHDAKGGDLPPPPLCARTWRDQLMAAHPRLALILLLGRPAIRWHLGPAAASQRLDALAAQWRERLAAPTRPRIVVAPHPSWRNNAWLKRNPWFEAEAIPAIRAAVASLL